MLSDVDQRVFLLQILNEVCNGFRFDDFEGTVGFSRDDARNLWSKLKDGENIGALSRQEVSVLRRATTLTLDELEDGVHEFQTRTGFAVADGRKIVEVLAKIEAGE